MTALLTGLALGVAGSGHCAGMCGPLVLTVGGGLAGPSRKAQLRHALLYHAGRLALYAALAVPAGVAGEALAARGLGRAVALAAGLLRAGAAVGALRTRVSRRVAAACAVPVTRAAGAAHRWSRRHPAAGAVLTGGANGLLPCGLVYAAVAAAAAQGSAAGAVALMIGFGLGTAPVLVVLSVWAASIPVTWRPRLRRLTPIVLAITAALLFARALGVPHHETHAAPNGTAAAHHDH